MMNLKDAFRYQNKLQQLLCEAEGVLEQPRNITRVHTTYLHSKVMPEAEDETVEEPCRTEYGEHITELVDFVMWLLDEQEKLTSAIHVAKTTMPMAGGMDGQVSLNRTRQRVTTMLRRMTALRAGEVLEKDGGTGYRFNNEGNQVSYYCDTKTVTTINFDRNRVRKHCMRLSMHADEVPAALDLAVVNTPVSYTPPFDVNDTFADVFEDFLHQGA